MYCDGDDDGVVFFFVRRHNEVGTSTVVLISKSTHTPRCLGQFLRRIFLRTSSADMQGRACLVYILYGDGGHFVGSREEGGRRINHKAVR